MSREISYERNLTGSFMKILLEEEECPGLDERILCHCSLPGLLPMQSCLVDGRKQLWFTISGKQSLEAWCEVRKVGIELIEQIFLQICRQVELLESYLVDVDCLCLHEELIYITATDKEIAFAALWDQKKPIRSQIRELLEYLLTRLDHKDQAAVQTAYSLYEMVLSEAFALSDLRETILSERRRMEAKEERTEEIDGDGGNREPVGIEEEKAERRKSLLQRFLDFLDHMIGEGEDEFVFAPEYQRREPKPAVSYPTVCLADKGLAMNAVLLYEGPDHLPDIHLGEQELTLGKARDCSVVLPKETVSLYHARITRSGEEYQLEDLNSTNGTYVNGVPLAYKEKHVLKTGDMVRVADLRYRFAI